MSELSPILAIAYRDLVKFLRDRARLIGSFIFPVIIIGVLGGSFQSNLGAGAGFDFVAFTFTGVLGQMLFQSSASGIISLIDDRENDFSQEIFVSPISRYSIIFGKILGESLVALVQGTGIVLFGLVIGVPMGPTQIVGLLPGAVAACLLGGSFGVLIMANLGSRQAVNQIFPFVLLPQFFLAGVFNPIRVLPLPLEILSLISPMRYAVDLLRGVFYAGSPEYQAVVLQSPLVNLTVMGAMFTGFLVAGTVLFVRRERNRCTERPETLGRASPHGDAVAPSARRMAPSPAPACIARWLASQPRSYTERRTCRAGRRPACDGGPGGSNPPPSRGGEHPADRR